MSTRITVKAFIKTPTMPNYVHTLGGGCVDVANLTDEVLREIGQSWTDELLEHAKKRRKLRKSGE